MSNVVGIRGAVPHKLGEPRPELVSILKDMLAKAESGELQSLIGTGFTSDGGRMAIWCEGEPHVYAMLGSLAWLQHEYVQRHTEAIEE